MLIIDPRIQQPYPELKIVTLQFNNINNQTSHQTEYLASLLLQEQTRIRQELTLEQLLGYPRIQQWREAYKTFGVKSKKHWCSVENLYRMILLGKDIPSINPLVDLYNYISLKYMLPLGADDLDNITGPVQLTIADGTEHFIALGSAEITHPKPGEIIYKDDTRVLCRRWNWRECEETKITEGTRNAILYIEALQRADWADVAAAQQELQDLMVRL